MSNSDTDTGTGFDRLFVRNMLESTLRIGIVLILLSMAYDIIRPFVMPLLWGGIIAIAAFPLTRWLQSKLGGRRGLAATLVTLFFILSLVVPSYMFTESLVGGVKKISASLDAGSLEVPAPPAKIAEIPVVGQKIYDGWAAANQNLDSVLENMQPQIKAAISTTVSAVGGGLLEVLMFVVALIIAGGFMTYAESTGAAAHRLFVRVGGPQPGGEWATLSVATVRSVLQGVVGVAIIQAILCAIGLFALDVPGAPVWSTIILFLAIAQLPPLILIAPIIAWAYGNVDATSATIFTVWMLVAGASDSFLKPMLMGRGLDIPMPVILIGAIGGMIAFGIIGLFAGAVLLSILYKLFGEWITQESH
jgi:predicted PurR-regulated permease PerM